MIRLLATIALATALAVPAFAQPANMRPTRDVTVTYRMTGMPGAPPQETRMAFSPSTGRQRVDPPGNSGWMLIDRQKNTAVLVMDAQRMAISMPPATVAAVSQEAPAGATFTRKGTATVAGNSCVEWEISLGQMRGLNCITEDGVMLRATTNANGSTVVMEATQVAYGTIDPTRLSVPAGYTTQQMPAGAAPPPR